MGSTEEIVATELYRCYHCGLESTGDSFKYFDNKKVDQPRFQCEHCHKLFTLGSHGRPQGKTYAKKRNEDPAELKSLSRQCRHCGVADNAPFKYYNNNNLSQPRFKCLSCGKQFQMRLLGTGEGRHLVHTSSRQRTAPCRRKQGVSEPLPNASSSSEDGSYQPFDGTFMPVLCDPVMALEPDARLLPEMGDEDVQYSNFIEAELAHEENYEADFNSWTGNGGNLEPPPWSGEDAQYSDFIEAKLLAEENNEAPKDDAFTSTAYALPPAWSNEDAEFMEANVRHNEALCAYTVSHNTGEMVSESTPNNTEVMYGTLALESPTAFSFEPWTWTDSDTSVDPFSMDYADAAAASCLQMDLDTAPWALAT